MIKKYSKHLWISSSTAMSWKYLSLKRVTINMGLGEAKENAKIMETAVEEIGLITGQRPV
jgi:ribosomal protein L5